MIYSSFVGLINVIINNNVVNKILAKFVYKGLLLPINKVNNTDDTTITIIEILIRWV